MGMPKKTTAVRLGDKAAPAEAETKAAPAATVEDHSEAAVETPAQRAPLRATESLPATTPAAASREIARPTAGGVMAPVASEPDGFEDLDDQIGFGSFPILTLSNGTFSIGDEEIGTSLKGILQQSRKKHLYKEGGVEDTEYVIYSYDELHDTGGKPLAAVFDEWVESGVERSKIEHKQYSEAVFLITEEGKHQGEMVLLSIPPASIKRFAGYRAELKTIRRATPQQVVTNLLVGKTIKKEKKSFNPWNFKFVRKATEEDLQTAFQDGGGEEE